MSSVKLPFVPHTRASVGLTLTKEPQDAVAVRGSIGSGIHMNDLVAGVRLQISPALLDGAKTRRADAPPRHPFRSDRSKELLDVVAMGLQYRLDAVVNVGSRVESRNRVRFRVIADVLDPVMLRQGLAKKLEVRIGWQCDRTALEIRDLTPLQRIHNPAARAGIARIDFVSVHDSSERAPTRPNASQTALPTGASRAAARVSGSYESVR